MSPARAGWSRAGGLGLHYARAGCLARARLACTTVLVRKIWITKDLANQSCRSASNSQSSWNAKSSSRRTRVCPTRCLIRGLPSCCLHTKLCTWIWRFANLRSATFTPADSLQQIPGLLGTGRYFVLWTIVAILVVLWLLGWGMQVAGIHLLLLLAFAVVLLWRLAGAKPSAKPRRAD